MDEIARRSGVTKRTLYYHFRSKDDLVAAWLHALDAAVSKRYHEWLHAVSGPIEERLAHMFGALARHTRDPRWKGCGFARAANELAGLPGHPGVRAAQRHRRQFESWLAAELHADGIEDHERLARRMILLIDGAIVQALLHHDPSYVEEAGETAVQLVVASRSARPMTARSDEDARADGRRAVH
jgi:AcrR family transcriptional regulator